MSYFKVLGFQREPFSTSPDPAFFYLSKEHETALTNIIIELRLKRGLSVILGDVGTGKTTLSRKLIQELTERKDCVFNIILNPSFENEELFLSYLLRSFEVTTLPLSIDNSILSLRESFERFLFQKGVTEDKTIILIVDEAQKLNGSSLELLRILLNYETNQFKLLQLILLGQLELYSKIIAMPNFFDRVSFKLTLDPLDMDETAQLIEFRIAQAGYNASLQLFTGDAIKEIHHYTHGYPRQVTMFCHKALKALVLKNKYVVDAELVKNLVEEEIRSGWHRNTDLLQKAVLKN